MKGVCLFFRELFAVFTAQFATSEKRTGRVFRSPLVLLPNEVLFGKVDQVDHRLRGDEEVLVQHFDLKE